MELVRTPDERFANLEGWTFEPVYVEVTSTTDPTPVRMATYSYGPDGGEVILLLHGEPSWSYLYRNVARVIGDAGYRAVMVDLVGFGRSDKPVEMLEHSFARHVEWVRQAVFDQLGLEEVTIVGQDWGGLIGLRLAAENTDQVARIVAANTGLPTGEQQMPELWWRFKEVMTSAPEINIGWFVASGCVRGLSAEGRAAYDAPFPDSTYWAGPRAMPSLVPTSPDDPAAMANQTAWAVLQQWTKPVLVAFSDSDPITADMAPILMRVIPGAADRDHPVIVNAGHFLQEDAGEELGAAIVSFLRATAKADA